MDARELRIGNIVSDFGGREARVSAITARGTMKLSSENYTDESFNFTERVIAPIPLTEEWLTRFGFVQNVPIASREYNLFEKSTNWLAVNHYGDGWLVKCDFWKVGVMIKNVHTLQNLYFALTGAELELKQ